MIPDAALDAAYQAYGWTGERRTSVSEILADVVTAALPHLLTDEMVERAAGAIYDDFGYELDSEDMFEAAYWKQIARRALEGALGDAS